MAVADIGEAILPSPTTISVAHHGYVPRVLQTVEPPGQATLVDAVQQSSHIHPEITMTCKTTPQRMVLLDGGHRDQPF